jgi:hypothetical protein
LTRARRTTAALRIKASSLSQDELRDIILKHLPAWARACAAESEAIVLHETAFGTSDGELFLFGCAIKYAAGAGKAVHVTCGKDSTRGYRTPFPPPSIQEIYRDASKPRRNIKRLRP